MNSDMLLASLRHLMNDYGEVVTLVKTTSGTYSVATGSVSGGSSANHSVIGYFFNNHPSEAVLSTVETGRKRLAVYAKKTDGTALPAPDTEDTISAASGTITGSITEVQTIRANGQPMVYLLRIET